MLATAFRALPSVAISFLNRTVHAARRKGRMRCVRKLFSNLPLYRLWQAGAPWRQGAGQRTLWGAGHCHLSGPVSSSLEVLTLAALLLP